MFDLENKSNLLVRLFTLDNLMSQMEILHFLGTDLLILTGSCRQLLLMIDSQRHIPTGQADPSLHRLKELFNV
jgi:hypothetical protein